MRHLSPFVVISVDSHRRRGDGLLRHRRFRYVCRCSRVAIVKGAPPALKQGRGHGQLLTARARV